jgi:4'-phosphopantetheinyl transferase
MLSPEELTRANRFHFPLHRDQFVVARGVLRYLLSHYMEIPASRIRFAEGAHGKPELLEKPRYGFNVSHSGGLAMYAVSDLGEIGIDIEQHREMDDVEGIAKRFFAPEEVWALEQLSAEERRAAFFRCWSRKEAVVKAIGAGLSLPLDSFCVSIDDNPELSVQGRLPGGMWTLFDVTPRCGYSAALAAQGAPLGIYCARTEEPAKLLGYL